MEPAVGQLGEMTAFLAVAQRKSFSAAAKQLGLTSSSVSKQIARLELRLGVQLLRRTTRQVTLTDAGIIYAERAARIVADVEDAQKAVADFDKTPRGTLRITAPTVLGPLYVAPAVLACRARHTELRIEVDFIDRIIDIMAERIDVAVRVVTEVSPSSLVARRLAHDLRVLCASPAYLRRHGTPKRLEDLADHDCLTLNFEPTPRWTLIGPEGERVVAVDGSLRANDSLVLRDAALLGLGIGNFPAYAVRQHLETGALQRVLPDYGTSPRTIFAVHTAPARAAVRVFVDALSKEFQRC